ncbi:MAG TPA: response regulator [Herpetosiphonaceae bacterium]
MPKTVFIIDDDANILAVLEIALKQAGYHVELASDGEEGLARLETIQPDVVVSDVMMPNMDGVQFFRAIQQRLSYEGVPIIMMTALARKPWFTELEAEGAVVVHKPFHVERLVSLIEMYVAE